MSANELGFLKGTSEKLSYGAYALIDHHDGAQNPICYLKLLTERETFGPIEERPL